MLRALTSVVCLVALACIPVQAQQGSFTHAERLMEEGAFREAEEELTRQLERWDSEDTTKDSLRAVGLQMLGWCVSERGQMPQAFGYFKSSLRIRERQFPKDHPEILSTLEDICYLLHFERKYSDAIPYVRKLSEAFGRVHGDTSHVWLLWLGNLGFMQYKSGQYAAAEHTLREVMDRSAPLFGTVGPPYMTALNNIAGLYKATGRYEDAERSYRELLYADSISAGHDSLRTIPFLNNLAHLYKETGRWREAERMYKQALELHEVQSTLGSRSFSTVLNNLGMLYMAAEKYRLAEPYFRRSREIDSTIVGVQHPVYADDLNNLASWHWRMGNTEMAERLFVQSMEIRRNYLGERNPDYITSLSNIALVRLATGQLEEAEALFETVVQTLLEFIRENFPALSEKEKADYVDLLRRKFDGYNSFALQREKRRPAITCDMYNLQLVIKGLLFRNTRRVRERIQASGDNKLLADFRSWEEQKLRLAGLLRLPRRERERSGWNIDSLLRACNDFEKALSRNSEAFAAEYDREAVHWEDVRSRLAPGEAAVEILRFELFDTSWTDKAAYCALIVTAQTEDRPALVVFPHGEKMERFLLDYYRSAVHRNEVDSTLYRYFWAPLSTHLDGIRRVYLSSDGVFHLLNPQVLPHPGGGFLFDSLEIRFLTTTADLMEIGASMGSVGDAALVGGPEYGTATPDQQYRLRDLPGTVEEVRKITTLLREHGLRCRALSGPDATETRLRNGASPHILHLATHGYFLQSRRGSPAGDISIGGYSAETLEKHPLLRSGIFLAGANVTLGQQVASAEGDDGILSAFEAMHLDLHATEVVVLSACETGLGTVQAGEGVYGLQRAMRVAGARAVIMSLWKVDDRVTTELMTAFYRHWLEGASPSAAFHEAVSTTRQNWPHPALWGAFVYVGL